MRTLVQDVMTTAVAAVCIDTTTHAIAEVLDAHKISAAPVVDADNRVIGVVSEVDVLRNVYTSRTAAAIMSTPPITVLADQPAMVAARIMDSYCVKRLPVVDDHGRLVGVVSRSDLVRAYARGDELRLTST
jgi:CBS domain-containing protein